MDLSQELTYLKGVGPSRADILAKELQITCQEDLLYYFPYKYIDRSRIFKIAELTSGMPYVQVCGRIVSFQQVGEGRAKRLTAKFSDDTGSLELVWFKGLKYIQDRYKTTETYLVFGKPAQYGNQLTIAHPDLDVANERNLKVLTGGLQAYYNTTEKMKGSYLNSRALQKIMVSLFQSLNVPLAETLPNWLLTRLHLMPLNDALRQVHFPTDAVALRDARYRLKLEELLFLQLQILQFAQQRNRKLRGYPFRVIGDNFNNFYHHCLPFTLTGAQKRVLKEIRTNVAGEVQMNRLIQGDVGSGKTLVALMTMLIALDNGYQACLMAPTEILAEQHAATFREFLKDMPVRVELLTGAVTGKKRRDPILEGVADGSVQILIGTHALIEDSVVFRNLGLAVIDEQHRFGVAQRGKLWKKNTLPPHVLVMTATPIPRTLAMTLYGDLDVSVIDELPPGRKPIETLHFWEERSESLYRGIRQQVSLGRQVYVVYPLIKESEKIDLQNLEEGYALLCNTFPDLKISKVHGQMKPADKDAEMERFASGETQILVATTVIEVGVNVPNASVMIIQNAERFGLAQLHQLRGRVGRGAEQSYCILVTKYKLSKETKSRIQIMCETNDGFEIAEADLRQRGPGDLEGTQQSGIAFDLHVANLARDGQLVQLARDTANYVLDNDPSQSLPGNAPMWRRLYELTKNEMDWSNIS